MVAAAVGVVAAADAGAVVADARRRDRVGISWRPELAPGIYLHLSHIDVLEVLADNFFVAPRRMIGALRALGREVPLTLHGVGMGLASTFGVEMARVEPMARLAAALEPESWSEHLAFVRAGGTEIGHLAVPPRTIPTVEGALANIERAARVVGTAPEFENVATLVEPPGSTLDEAAWVRSIIRGSGTSLLLDLHNLYANARNFGHDPLALLEAMPLAQVRCVHISGGRWINAPSGGRRLLDDHLHDPPGDVYLLLEHLAALTAQPLTVILERDGHYPPFAVLVAELDGARAALARGRRRRGLLLPAAA